MLPPPQLHHQQPIGQDSKGKGKAAEADLLAADNHAWEQAFAQFSPPAVSEQDQRAQPQESQEEEDDLVKNINAQWRDMHNSVRDSAQSDVDLAAWESQHSSVMQQLNDEGEDYLSAGRRPFSIEEMQQNPPEWQWLSEERVRVYVFRNDDFTDSQCYTQVFEDFSDPFAEGMRLLHSGAPFIQVEQAFEEACRRDDQRVEAWTALGEALAADEKEHLAIRALEKAVSIKQSSAGPNAESAWISLAVSYINEAQDRQALHVLEQWLHRMYPGLKHASPLATMASQAEYENPWANHQKVINLFIDAARAGPAARAKDTRGPTVTDSIDADVQLGLGVLLYSNSDYDLAKDCFEAALSVRPDVSLFFLSCSGVSVDRAGQDYLLWNRLGATMANGGHPEDAIHACETLI